MGGGGGIQALLPLCETMSLLQSQPPSHTQACIKQLLCMDKKGRREKKEEYEEGEIKDQREVPNVLTDHPIFATGSCRHLSTV